MSFIDVFLCRSRQSRSSDSTKRASPSIGDVSGDEIDSVVASVRSDGDESGVPSDTDRAVRSAANFVDMEVEESDGHERYVYAPFENLISC